MLRDIKRRFNNKLLQFWMPSKFCWPGRIVHGKSIQSFSSNFSFFHSFFSFFFCTMSATVGKNLDSKEAAISIPSICPLKSEMIKWGGKKNKCSGHQALYKSVLKVSVNSYFKEYFSLQDWNSFKEETLKGSCHFRLHKPKPFQNQVLRKKIEAL